MYLDKILISFRHRVFEIAAMHYPKMSFLASKKRYPQGDMADANETIMVLSMTTTEIPTGQELVSESAKNVPQDTSLCPVCGSKLSSQYCWPQTEREYLTRDHQPDGMKNPLSSW